ncbi:hypothetical protein GCM10022420_055980 [Streptomyces iranensis]
MSGHCRGNFLAAQKPGPYQMECVASVDARAWRAACITPITAPQGQHPARFIGGGVDAHYGTRDSVAGYGPPSQVNGVGAAADVVDLVEPPAETGSANQSDHVAFSL